MRRIRNLILYPGLASVLLAVGTPAAAMAQSAAMPTAPDTCSGSVFSNTKLQNVASDNYLAESTSDNSAVLYTHSNQAWDGYRDSAGHVIIYRCGTNDVLTDGVNSHCRKGYGDCVYVEAYNDSQDQWWSRIAKGNIWDLQTLDTKGKSHVIDDPLSSRSEGTHVVMEPFNSARTNEQFRVTS